MPNCPPLLPKCGCRRSHYLTYPAADGFQAALAAAQAQETQHQPRRYAADFAAVPASAPPALYIGVEGEVRISEEEVFDD